MARSHTNGSGQSERGGANGDFGQAIASDSYGNQYVTGYFSGTATFGPFTLISSGGYDVFAAKLDSGGNFLWAVSAGGTGNEESYDIAVDNVGNAYLTGYFVSATVMFGIYSLTSSGVYDIFVTKLDPAGNFVWAVSAGGTAYDQGNSIAVDSSGNSFLTGYFESATATFGPHTITSSGGRDIFIAKVDSAGNFLWAVSAGGTVYDDSFCIAVDSLGNAYLTGQFESTNATFGNYSLTSNGQYDVFAAKLDPEGSFVWAVSAGGSSYDYGEGIATDSLGNVYLTGFFYETATFGPHTLTSSGLTDTFAAKLDTDGNFLWAVKAGGTTYDRGNSIAVDSVGKVYITGYFVGTASFGIHSLLSSGVNDIFAAKLDSSGNWLWAIKAGESGNDRGSDIALDGTGNAYITGYF